MKFLRKLLLAVLLAFFTTPVLSQCPTEAWVCDIWPPYLNMDCPTPTGWCEGEDCIEGARGNELQVSASVDSDDLLGGYDEFTNRWLLRHDGEMTNLSCKQLLDHPYGNFITIPESRHCATILVTEANYYLEFFASNPTSDCVGWVECLCN